MAELGCGENVTTSVLEFRRSSVHLAQISLAGAGDSEMAAHTSDEKAWENSRASRTAERHKMCHADLNGTKRVCSAFV